jgi:hypothetical protein
MNAKNLEFLKEGIKYLGFGEGLNNKLTEELSSGKNEFQLRTENQYGKDKVNYTLDFSKSDKSDMYFFNKYSATLPGQKPDEDKTQTFFIKKNSGVTAKEAYNLLNGRSVNKDLTNQEGEKYNAWLQIDWKLKDNHGNHKFKMIHEAYGFDLEKTLKNYPIKEMMDDTSKNRLMQSLERGNVHEVSFVKGDKQEKMFIEANPQFKTLNVYNGEMKKVYQENDRKEPKVDNGKEVSTPKESQKQSTPVDEPDEALTSEKKQPKRKLKV